MNNEQSFFWLIGILEGEGNFYITKDNRRVRVKVSMSDLDTIERVATILNTSVRGYMPSQPRDHRDRSKMFEAALSGCQAAKLMKQVLPYMSQRRATKIREALHNWAPFLQGKGHCRGCSAIRQELNELGF